MTMEQIRQLVASAPADDKQQDRTLACGTKIHNGQKNIKASQKSVLDVNFVEGCRVSHYRAQFR